MRKPAAYALIGILVMAFGWTSYKVKRSELEGGTLVFGKGQIEIKGAGKPLTGRKAPGFSLQSLEGRKVSLSDFRGEVVLLCIWASWSPPSRPAMIYIPPLEAKYKDKGLNVITINQGETREQATAFAQAMKPRSMVLLDEDGSVSIDYDARNLPAVVLIGKDGKVAWYRGGFGPFEFGTLERRICDLLEVKYVQGFGEEGKK